MSGRSTHLVIGVVFSATIAVAIGGLTLFHALVGGAIGSILPDIIEPADHYRHRAFFHSRSLLKYLLIGTLVSLVLSFPVPIFWFMFYACIGYVMHLAADATTKMGLPD